MSYKSLASLIVLSILVLSSSGCVRVNTGDNLATFGHQIVDLVGAHESGFLSDDEFRMLRGNLIRNFGR